jgi:FK506-binding protein 4/5
MRNNKSCSVSYVFRGQAYLGLGEPEKAKVDFEAVHKLDPNNKAAATHIILCNKEIKEQKVREKKIYANMFEKFAQRDREVGTPMGTAEVK